MPNNGNLIPVQTLGDYKEEEFVTPCYRLLEEVVVFWDNKNGDGCRDRYKIIAVEYIGKNDFQYGIKPFNPKNILYSVPVRWIKQEDLVPAENEYLLNQPHQPF